MTRDRTAQTEPLTVGQQLVARWESGTGWSEPADLAEAIDAEIEKAVKAYAARLSTAFDYLARDAKHKATTVGTSEFYAHYRAREAGFEDARDLVDGKLKRPDLDITFLSQHPFP